MEYKEKNSLSTPPICIAAESAPLCDDFLRGLFGSSVRQDAPEPEPEPRQESVHFGRDSIDGDGERIVCDESEPELLEKPQQSYQPPLPLNYTPNRSLPLKDCVYSSFQGYVHTANATRRYGIFFMIAPFVIEEDNRSTNIVLYARYREQNYAITSLNNSHKNSLLFQIAEFQFLARGKFVSGKWSAEVRLAGDSIKKHDVFEIKMAYHNNPENIGTTNGHIRFFYDGYINHHDIVSSGCVNIFPMDMYGETFLIIRCIEDFIDAFYTDETPEIEMRTDEGVKWLSVSNADGVITAEITAESVEEKASAEQSDISDILTE